jgi:molybdate transport system substrate-binding protein
MVYIGWLQTQGVVMFTRRSFTRVLAAATIVILGWAAVPATPLLAADNVVVFAAASLKNALDNVNAAWKAESGKEATISYAASSALAKQIESAAPADIFISADLQWMKYLSDKKFIKPGSEVELLGNSIVLIAPKDSAAEIAIGRDFALAKLLGDGKLAMADVKAVPAGKYGKAALEKLGVWSTAEGKVAQAENVRAALKLVAAGEASLGIVYQTDARAEPAVRVIGTFPSDTHEPIVYPIGITAESKNADAEAFARFVQSAKAKTLFEEQGFTFLVAPVSN